MKKRVFSILMLMVMLFSTVVTAYAADVNNVESAIMAQATMSPDASLYLDSYSVALGPKGNGIMTISMTVNGVGIMDKIGARELFIEKNVNGAWQYYLTLDGATYPEFYNYNSRSYVGSTTFTGTPGVSYRVTLTAYAKKGTGSDTGYVTSPAVVCQ